MTANELVGALERLVATPLAGPAEGFDEEAWYQQGRTLIDAAGAVSPPISPAFLHYLNHYMADVDIRRREVAYRESQDAALTKYLRAYRAQLSVERARDR